MALDPRDDQHVLTNRNVNVVLYHCLSREVFKQVSDKQIMSMLWDIA